MPVEKPGGLVASKTGLKHPEYTSMRTDGEPVVPLHIERLLFGRSVSRFGAVPPAALNTVWTQEQVQCPLIHGTVLAHDQA